MLKFKKKPLRNHAWKSGIFKRCYFTFYIIYFYYFFPFQIQISNIKDDNLTSYEGKGIKNENEKDFSSAFFKIYTQNRLKSTPTKTRN